MICVEWKGKVGYGDLTSPCAYVNNLAEKTGEKVILEFVWMHEKGVKDPYEKDDCEDVVYRLETIFDMMKEEDVELRMRFGENLPYKHTELPKHDFYNYRLARPEYRWSEGQDYVTFVTTENNKVQFTDYHDPSTKIWKDPTNGNWEPIYSKFENVKFVDYDTPIHDAIEILRNTDLMISYDGSASSLARIMGVPSYILSGHPSHTLSDFPNAVISPKIDFFPDEIVDIQEVCLEKIDEAEIGRKNFLTFNA